MVQVWNAELGDIETTLNFGNSSVLDITWHPNGESLAVAGYQGAKIWMVENWDDEPCLLPVDSASLALAWSPDGKYIASGNMERTITVLEWNNPIPWVMQGFPGKIRCLGWSDTATKSGAPLLAASSVEGIAVWEKDGSEWDVRILSKHEDVVQSLQFQPNSYLLASAGADGRVCLWNKGRKLIQFLDGADGDYLAYHGIPKDINSRLGEIMASLLSGQRECGVKGSGAFSFNHSKKVH
jgi:WD40 repeat protein